MKQIRTRASLRAVLAVFAVAAMAACASALYRQPTIELESVGMGGMGLTGGTLLVNVRIQNPNSFTLGADRVTYDLAVRTGANNDEWSSIAQGTYSRPFRVKGGRTEVVQIPVEFSYAGARGIGGALLRRGSVVYRAKGTVLAHTPVGDRELPFQQDGTFTNTGTVIQ
jgi:LEA14-like dessication related protein